MWLQRAMGNRTPAISPIENNPVGWSSIYAPEVVTNPSPDVSPLASALAMTPEQKVGRFWNLAMGQAKPAYTNADLPQLSAAGNEALDSGMGWATTTPIRAYHASPNAFDRFDINKAGSTTDAGDLGRAIYFTTDAQTAMSPPFAGPGTKMPHRYEASLSVKNPLELLFPSWSADKGKLIREKLGLSANASAREVTDKAQSLGHDSVALDYSPVGYNAKEIAVFNPQLIDILRRYGLFGLGMTGGAMGAAQQYAPQGAEQ